MSEDGAWVDLIELADLEPGDVTPVSFKGRALAVYDGLDGISITSGRCTHGAANLCDGYFDGRRIECPLHQGLFDCRTGEALAAPASRGLRVFESRIQDQIVQIFWAGGR